MNESYPSIMLEYSSRCNLRCKYCTKSADGDDAIPGRNQDMTETNVEKFLEFLSSNPVSELLLAGTGETTVAGQWTKDIPLLINAAKRLNPYSLVHLNSNFAKRFTANEFSVLQKLDRINISIDTDDYDLTKAIRAKSSLADIMFNIIKLKSYCLSRGLNSPEIIVVAVVTAETFKTLPSLIYTLSLIPIDEIVLCDLMETQATMENLILGLDNAGEIKSIINQLDESVRYLRETSSVKFNLQPEFRQRLTDIIYRQQGASPRPNFPSSTTTKICTQPWTRFTIGADYQIFPCCVTGMQSVGVFNPDQDAFTNFNNVHIKEFRNKLLTGDLPPSCEGCTNAPDGSPDELSNIVQAIFNKSDLQIAGFSR